MIYAIGIGAAGNKAVIKALELKIIPPINALLINSTEKDIPENYNKISFIIGNNLKGCGKERKVSQDAMISFLKETEIFNRIPASTDRVIVITSSEGGTGSGSAPILARYIRDVLGYNTSIFAFTGFENDVRGIKNTIEFMKELDEEITIQIISNKKFLEEANNSYSVAQDLANTEFCRRLKIMTGDLLEAGSQNIDDTDLHKLLDAPGLLDIAYTDIHEPLKNVEMFNKLCSKLADESKSIDFAPTASRLGIIFNRKVSNNEIIDFSYKVFKSKYGEPYEEYTHLQENIAYSNEFLACIASGMKLPIDAIQRTYEEYLERSKKISKDKDSFFDIIGEFEESEEDKAFELRKRNVKSNKEDFFKNF